ncbi:MAG: alpha/beta hydrolase family protein [Solirubrobacteraceae bacterium]
MPGLAIFTSLFSRHRTVRYGEHGCQRADLHLPTGPGPHPLAVVIHGGSWRATFGKIVMRPVCADLARRGWAAWNIEYRRIGRGQGGGWPATFEDVASAIDHLALLDAPVDLGRVVFVGHSAGGQLALWAAGRHRLPDGAPGAGPGVAPIAAVSLAGVNDLGSVHRETGGGAVGHLMGGSPERHPDRYAVGDPILAAPLDLPVLLVHGTDDQTVSVRRSRDYLAAAGPGADVELVEIPGAAGRHRSQIDPAGPGWAAAAVWLERFRPVPA